MSTINSTQDNGRSRETYISAVTEDKNSSIADDYDIHDLLALGYAMSDYQSSAKESVDNTVCKVQSSCIRDFMRIKNSLHPASSDGKFMTRFLMCANSYAHYIRSSRRKLEQIRELCKEKRLMALDLETKISGRNSYLRLSGQLFLIGGITGIVTWFLLGEARISEPGWHQVLMSIGGAMGAMFFGMAAQLTGMSNATRRIDLAYHIGLDRAKEMQANSLKIGLIKAKEDFEIILKKRFGEADPRKLDINSELSIFDTLRSQEDTRHEITLWEGFKLFLKRMLGLIPKESDCENKQIDSKPKTIL